MIGLFVAGAAVVGLIAVLAARSNRDRHEALRAWAASREASYAERDDEELRRLEGILFRRGGSRKARHVVRGRFAGYPTTLFEHVYTTTSGTAEQRSSTTHRWQVAVIELPTPGPDFALTPRSWLGKLTAGTGLDRSEVSLGPEFDRAFSVRTGQPAQLRDLLQPLLGRFPEDQHLHRRGPLLVAYRPGRADGEAFDAWLLLLRPLAERVALEE